MGLGGVATAALPSVVRLQMVFSDRLVGGQVLLFTHEWIFYPQHNLKFLLRAKLIKILMNIVFKFYEKHNYNFVFPIEILKYKVNG